jgi:predicted P-loop ATPase/GTPase
MSNARLICGDMLHGFILVTALKFDDEINEVLNRNPQEIDFLINTDDISHAYQPDDEDFSTIVLMNNTELKAKDTLDEIINKLRKATAINWLVN